MSSTPEGKPRRAGRMDRLTLSVTDKPFLAEAPAPRHCCPGAYSACHCPESFPRVENAHTAIIPNHKALRSYISRLTAAGHVCLFSMALRWFLRALPTGTASLRFDSWLCYQPASFVTLSKLQPLSFTTCKRGAITASQS